MFRRSFLDLKKEKRLVNRSAKEGTAQAGGIAGAGPKAWGRKRFKGDLMQSADSLETTPSAGKD